MKTKVHLGAAWGLLIICGWYPVPLAAQALFPQSWAITGSLANGRAGHTATLLRDGRVLIAGGYGESGDLASCELYQPYGELFVRTGDLHTGRSEQTATLLPNGQVLVVGGQFLGKTLASAELYNPATDVWTETGSLHVARSFHTATLLPNGQVLVVGGTQRATPPLFPQGAPPGGAVDIAELYDPTSGNWTMTDSLHTARYGHRATLLRSGQVLVTGGIGSHGPDDILASAELYNPGTRTWTVTGSLGKPHFLHSATLLTDGSVLVAGGDASEGRSMDSAEVYNPSSGTWAPTGNLQEEVNAHSATLLPDGDVLVVGGAARVSDGGDLNSEATTTNVELYNPATGLWEKRPGLNAARSLHTATLLANGHVLIVGGEHALGSPDHTFSSVEISSLTQAGQVSTPMSVLETVHSSPPAPDRTISHLIKLAICLIILAICLVIFSICLMVFLGVGLLVVLISRWRK